MNALVGYGSSDEEDDIQPKKPAEIAKTKQAAPTPEPKIGRNIPAREQQAQAPDSGPAPALAPSEVSGPAPGPSIARPEAASDLETDVTPFSPYTYERQRLRELTLPTIPNFDIPDSPPPPAKNSEEAATLAATTKKMERFLELKKQGVHFNERLQSTNSLRNPSLLPKLMKFAGIGVEDSYRSSLSEEIAIPVRWPEEVYVEGLLKTADRREKRKLSEREKLDFVPASKEAGVSGDGSIQKRKSKFHKR